MQHSDLYGSGKLSSLLELNMLAERKRGMPASPRLTLADAIEIWKRRRLGEAIHSIAAAFRVNSARISEVLNGKRFPEAERLSLI